VLSDIRMLRDFGFVTLIDLSVSLAGVLVALPASLMLFGAHEDADVRARASGRRPRRDARARAGAGDEEASAQPLAVALSATSSPARGAPAREEPDGGGR
jgi:hypothetical protein